MNAQYVEGWKAEKTGMIPSDNPYEFGSKEAAAWQEGYSSSLFDE